MTDTVDHCLESHPLLVDSKTSFAKLVLSQRGVPLELIRCTPDSADELPPVLPRSKKDILLRFEDLLSFMTRQLKRFQRDAHNAQPNLETAVVQAKVIDQLGKLTWWRPFCELLQREFLWVCSRVPGQLSPHLMMLLDDETYLPESEQPPWDRAKFSRVQFIRPISVDDAYFHLVLSKVLCITIGTQSPKEWEAMRVNRRHWKQHLHDRPRDPSGLFAAFQEAIPLARSRTHRRQPGFQLHRFSANTGEVFFQT